MNTPTKSFALLAVAALPLILSACGSSVAGDYTCHAPMMDTHLVLSPDGKLSHSAVIFGQTIEKTGTWKADGDKVAGTMDGVIQEFTIDGDNLTTPATRCTRNK